MFGMPVQYHTHYWPDPSLFKTSTQRSQVAESLFYIYTFFGFLLFIMYQWPIFFFTYYFAPYMIFNMWIGLVSHLHHTHPDAPWFRDPDWTYIHGALSTIDRSYGVLEEIHHNIGTHIVHHLFIRIPHYHLKEATEAIAPILGEYYKKSDERIIYAMLRIWRNCRFITDEGSTVFYQSPESSTASHVIPHNSSLAISYHCDTIHHKNKKPTKKILANNKSNGKPTFHDHKQKMVLR